MRTIDADALKEDLTRFYDNEVTARKLIDEQPTIQPEIVRCGECKWFQCNMRHDGYLPKGVDEFECRHWCGSCDPTDFCSYAERREVTA